MFGSKCSCGEKLLQPFTVLSLLFAGDCHTLAPACQTHYSRTNIRRFLPAVWVPAALMLMWLRILINQRWLEMSEAEVFLSAKNPTKKGSPRSVCVCVCVFVCVWTGYFPLLPFVYRLSYTDVVVRRIKRLNHLSRLLKQQYTEENRFSFGLNYYCFTAAAH